MPTPAEHNHTAAVDPELAAWLARPDAYPHPCRSVEFVSTHISLVALAGDFVYKLRRPVRFSYVDFSTLERRRADCLREVELNRPLAPGVHLGVLAITRAPDGFTWNGTGPPVDYAVQMQRLPADRTLAALLDCDQVSFAHVECLCDTLIDFYRTADRSPQITEAAMPAALERLIDDNLADVDDLPAALIPRDDAARINAALRQFLHDHAASFTSRASAGAAVDGHGDLRAEHIYMLDRPVIIDRLEFNDRLRYVDIASDIAFLINDLLAARQYELAVAALARLETVEPTHGFRTVLGFYRVLRGWVRAKVAATAAAAGDLSEPERAAWQTRAQRELTETVWTARGLAQPRIVALCGLPGSGKSTVAAILSERLGYVWLRSDVIRKELGLGQPAGGVDLYGDAMTRHTYDVLLKRTEEAVRDGRSVVADATFGARADRRRIRELAEHASTPFTLIECVCPDDVLRQRLTHRLHVPDAASDATIAQLAEIRARFDPVGELPDSQHVRIDTSQPASAVRDAVLSSI